MAAQCRRVVLTLVVTVYLATAQTVGGSDADTTPPPPTPPEKATTPQPPTPPEKATKPPPPTPPEKATTPPPPTKPEKTAKPTSAEKDTPPPPPDKANPKASTTATASPPSVTVQSVAAENLDQTLTAKAITTAATTTAPPPLSNASPPAIGATSDVSSAFTTSSQPATTTRWLPRAVVSPLASGNAEAMPIDVTASATVEPAATAALPPSPASSALLDTAVVAGIAAATMPSTATNSLTLASGEHTKKPPKPASGEKSPPPPPPSPPPPPLKEGENCSSSAQCKDGCCRRADGSLVDVFGHDGIQAEDVIVLMQGTCSKTLGDANEYCGSGCKCRGGFACYKPQVGVCCQPELCYEQSFVNRQESYLKRCQSRRGCTMPVRFDD